MSVVADVKPIGSIVADHAQHFQRQATCRTKANHDFVPLLLRSLAKNYASVLQIALIFFINFFMRQTCLNS